MKLAIIPALVLTAFSLAACGGGGGGDSTAAPNNNGNANQNQNPPASSGQNLPADSGQNQNPAPAPSQKLASTSQIIDYFGDSTIRGWDGASGASGNGVATPAPAVFADALPDTPSQTVRNRGKDGQTACQLLNGPNVPSANATDGKDWDTLMTESNATVVILNHGINDFNGIDPASDTVAEYTACLTQLASIARAKGKFVIFETPNPIANTGFDTYVQGMKSVATRDRIPVIDQYANLSTFINSGNIFTYIPDGLHPNQQTYRVKGEFAAAEFRKFDK